MLDHIDLFKQAIPSFNMRGRQHISSWPGGLMSFFIFFVILIYGALKFVILVSKANPNVSTYMEQNFYDSDEKINLKEKGIRFAFGIEGFLDKELKNDPRYVKIYVRAAGKRNGKPHVTMLDHHICSEDELA